MLISTFLLHTNKKKLMKIKLLFKQKIKKKNTNASLWLRFENTKLDKFHLHHHSNHVCLYFIAFLKLQI